MAPSTGHWKWVETVLVPMAGDAGFSGGFGGTLQRSRLEGKLGSEWKHLIALTSRKREVWSQRM